MEQLYLIREGLRSFYSKYEGYIRSALKFLLCLIVLTAINSKLGYMKRIDNTAIVLIISLLCSFLPANLIVFFSAVFVALHAYGLSLETAVVVAALFFLMFLLYYRYSPKDTLAVLITPLCFYLRIPYLMPVVFGLIGTPLSAVSVSCGVVSYYVIEYMNEHYDVLSGMADENTVARFKYIVDGLLQNKEMIVMIAAFSVTVVAVNVIKRLSIDHSWTIALLSGIVIDMFTVIIVGIRLDIKINAGALIIGSLLSALIAVIIKFFVFAVDYEKTERVQFEDDEYYYYVKAVPKIRKKTLGSPEKEKRIEPGRAQARYRSPQKGAN
ncbi:MAG: hypothetical protein J6P45_08885 [Lachnospiraceae bacterium]|nr:hypothetical protein [Lachnospiraceae bacterium]MBR1875780.1 hypothetical protein [Lachnospiraceae bacterium]